MILLEVFHIAIRNRSVNYKYIIIEDMLPDAWIGVRSLPHLTCWSSRKRRKTLGCPARVGELAMIAIIKANGCIYMRWIVGKVRTILLEVFHIVVRNRSVNYK